MNIDQTTFADNLRIRIIRPGRIESDADGCVLLWVQNAQRTRSNPAADIAIDLANDLDLPCIAIFCLVPAYPAATHRAYHFLAKGISELPESFAQRGVGWELLYGDPVEQIPSAAKRLSAVCLFTDEAPTREPRAWRENVAQRLDVPMIAVDADVVIPTAHFPKLEWAARTIRPKIERLLDQYLIPSPEPEAIQKSTHRVGQDPMELVSKLNIDTSVGPSPRFTGGYRAAHKRLTWFVNHHLASYDVDRNRSDIDGSSGLSAWLHFGQISPIEIALAARDALPGNGGEAQRSFFNELIVQRELAINFALREPAYDQYAGLPDWGRKTLAEHAGDPRPAPFTAGQLESGQTDDPLWNAAQRQLVAEGYMPNRLRMYWAKQVLQWTRSPEEAHAILVHLDDRYFVDGRDPNGYAGIAWAIGGRHDRPFPPNKPILGLVRPMGVRSMRRYFDTEAYIRQIAERYGDGAAQGDDA